MCLGSLKRKAPASYTLVVDSADTPSGETEAQKSSSEAGLKSCAQCCFSYWWHRAVNHQQWKRALNSADLVLWNPSLGVCGGRGGKFKGSFESNAEAPRAVIQASTGIQRLKRGCAPTPAAQCWSPSLVLWRESRHTCHRGDFFWLQTKDFCNPVIPKTHQRISHGNFY